ncbi:hypothetical protein Tco_0468283 [Tanacetum coccineum]
MNRVYVNEDVEGELGSAAMVNGIESMFRSRELPRKTCNIGTRTHGGPVEVLRLEKPHLELCASFVIVARWKLTGQFVEATGISELVVRNETQTASRIQAAFSAHSFNKRKQKKLVLSYPVEVSRLERLHRLPYSLQECSEDKLETMVKDLGYVNKGLQFYYKISNFNLDISLKPLSSDKDVMEMCKYVSKCKVIDVFVIHPINVPQLVSNLDTHNEFDPLFSYPDKNTDKDRASGSNARVSGSNTGKTPMVIKELDGTDIIVASDASEDSDDSDFDVGYKDRIEDVEVDMANFRKHTDGNVEWVGCNEEEVQVPPPFDHEEVDLEDFASKTKSDDNECEIKKALKKLAKKHRQISVEQRRELHFTRNNKIQMRAECRGLFLFLVIVGQYMAKGLIPALRETFPTVEHRYCLKHIYDNMMLQWRGEQYKDLLWRCATATTVQRSHFSGMFIHLNLILPHLLLKLLNVRPHCDILLNNMCEVLNRQILIGIDKPIITCLEFIREYLMKRIVIVQGVIGKSSVPLTPNATKVFNVIKRKAQYKVVWNGGDLYETIVASMWNMASNELKHGIPESWVHKTYWLKT